MSNSIVAQVPKNLLFRYRVPCHRLAAPASLDVELPPRHALPHFGEFEGQQCFADVRAGWEPDGLVVSVTVTGKQQSLWCRENDVLESDGVQLWFDTRNTHNVHRASKFCHWLVVLPVGGGPQSDEPIVSMLKINRSNEDSPTLNRNDIEAAVAVTEDGYEIQVHVPGKSLHGWNTEDHRQLGFQYAIVDRELGWQTLAIGPELPIREDPSLWQSLLLVDSDQNA